MTGYPGLLVGSGYAQSTKTKGDTTIGFYFDHTSGFPVIPGSSVKGVLRSLFEMDTDEKNGDEKTGKKSIEAIRFIFNNIIKRHPERKERFSELATNLNETSLEQLKIQIFGSQEEDGTDIFFDAWIDLEKSPEKHFLGEDFITPHHPDLLKNPTPLQFLKVLPNVVFGFQFQLENCELLSREEKSLVFEEIILTLGIGAKTNVGYGQFSPVKDKSESQANESGDEKTHITEGSSILDEITKASNPVAKRIVSGSKWTGSITAEKNDNFIVEFLVDDQPIRLKKKKVKIKGGDLNKKVTITFNAPFDNDSPNFTVAVIA